MSDETNIVNKEAKDNIAETRSGEDKGVKDENKIVPINKANSVESENAALTAELAAQLVAQYASQPLAQAVGQPVLMAVPLADSQPAVYVTAQAANQPNLYAVNQPANQAGVYAANQAAVYNAAPTASQAQLAIHAAGLSEGQPAAAPAQAAVSTQEAAQPVTAASPQTEAHPGAEAAAQTGAQPKTAEPASTSDAEAASFASASQAVNSADYMETEPEEDSGRGSRKRRFFRFEPADDFDFDEEERPKRRFFRFRSASDEETRDKLILSRIKDEDLMEYLALEQRRIEFLQQAKEAKEKRLLIAFQLLISLAAIVAITYLLQDNPTILISILYIVGIVAALNVWKNPHDRGRKR